MELLARRARLRSGAQYFLSPGYCPPLRWPGPFSFTIHDLIHLDIQAERSSGKHHYYERVVRPRALRAHRIFTVSEFSRFRILEWAGLPESRVIVAGNGVDDRFFADDSGSKLKSRRPYILHVGNHKPHKNLPRLIEALAAMANSDLNLVLSGSPNETLIDHARRHRVADRLVFAGRIPEDQLPSYYRSAQAVAIASLYEGFGLPALEGMAAGVPVVGSDRSALPEVIGDAGILIDPTDVGSIAGGLDIAVADSKTRGIASVRGPLRARTFTWNAVAGRIAAAVEIA